MKTLQYRILLTSLGLTLCLPVGYGQSNGFKATIFAPGVISTTAHEGPFAFTPDGQTLYFTRFAPGMTAPQFLISHRTNDQWSEPRSARMPQGMASSSFSISQDGQHLYYSHTPDANGRTRLWIADQDGEGWKNPRSLGNVFARWNGDQMSPSVTSDGTLFFSSNRQGGAGGWDLYRSRFVDGQYQEPVLLGPDQFARFSTQHHERSVSVSSNGATVVFSSMGAPNGLGGADLYAANLSSPLPTAVWTWNLGLGVNSEADETEPQLSLDGKRLFFCRSGDIYEFDLAAWLQRPQSSPYWRPRANMRTPRMWPQAVAVNGLIYVYGGHAVNPQTGSYDRWVNTVEVYDPSQNTWSLLGPAPRGWLQATLVAKDDHLFLFRRDGSGVAEYFPESKAWQIQTNAQPFTLGQVPPFMTRTVVLGQKAFTMLGGGYMGSFTYFVEYDFDTGRWTALASLPIVAPQLAVWKGRIFAFSGGAEGDRTCVYDPANNQWTESARMDMPRWEAGVAVFENKVWLVGGHSLRSDQPMDGNVSPSVVCFDPERNQWSVGPELPSQRGSVTALVANGRLFVMGGVKMGDPWSLDPSVLEYIPAPENNAPSPNTEASSELRIAVALADVRLTLKWPGRNGQVYRLWRAPALGEPWQTMLSAIPAEIPQTVVTLPAENTTAFFRLEAMSAP